MTTWLDYDHMLLALVMWREAAGEGREGMRAVGHVIRNRVNSGWGDWSNVMCSPAQFSSMTIKGDICTVRWPKYPDKAFITAMLLADAIHEGTDPDITGNAVYYYNPEAATSDWFKQNVAAKKVQTATLGHHVFFSSVDVASATV